MDYHSNCLPVYITFSSPGIVSPCKLFLLGGGFWPYVTKSNLFLFGIFRYIKSVALNRNTKLSLSLSCKTYQKSESQVRRIFLCFLNISSDLTF